MFRAVLPLIMRPISEFPPARCRAVRYLLTDIDELFSVALDAVRDETVLVGDAPNDAPTFGYFPDAVGVANVADLVGRLDAEPAWVTRQRGGHGFAEPAETLIAARRDQTKGR